MMDRQKGTIIFECDECGETFDAETTELELANLKRRGAGWNAVNAAPKGQTPKWEHRCPSCKRS